MTPVGEIREQFRGGDRPHELEVKQRLFCFLVQLLYFRLQCLDGPADRQRLWAAACGLEDLAGGWFHGGFCESVGK